MTTTTAGCAILLAAISLPAHVDGTPLPAQVGATASTCRDDEYWDPETGQCAVCVPCPQGWGSTVVECGNGIGAKGRCEKCEEGKTFQDQQLTTGSCRPCAHCDAHATVLSNCTTTQNTRCGPCQPGYGSHPDSSTFCSPCYLFNDNEKPPECLTTAAPTVMPSSSPPMQPTTNTTTSANGGSTVQNLPETTNVSEITTVLNATNSTTSLGREKTRTDEPETQGEREALTKGDTSSDAQTDDKQRCRIENGAAHYSTQSPSTSVDGDTSNHAVTTNVNGAQIGDPDIETIGLRPVQDEHLVRSSNPVENASEPLIQTHPSGVQSSGPKIERNGTSSVRDTHLASSANPVDDESPLQFPSHQASADGDVTDANSHRHTPQSTNRGDISPGIMPTIPEERNGPQGGSSRPTFNRQDSGKKQGILAKISRIPYKRSLSEPAGQKEGQAMASPNSTTPLVLGTTVREALNKDKKDEGKKKFRENFEKACSLGRNMQWTDLETSVRRKVAQMLTPDDRKLVLGSFSHLGEELGLNRQTQLKSCRDVNDVFDVLATQREVPVYMDEVLLKLKRLERFDVLRTVIEGILTKHSNRHD